MALVKSYKYKNATVDVYDDCYQGVTIEQAEKILEDAINATSPVRNSGGHVRVTHKSRLGKDTA